MGASTALSVGIGTVVAALTAGLTGGLLVVNVNPEVNPKPPAETAEAARLEQPAPPQQGPASGAVPYVGATLAFIDPSIADGVAVHERNIGAAPPKAQSVQAMTSSDQAAKSADAPASTPPTQAPTQAQPPPAAGEPASTPDDAYAKAHDADLKRGTERRHAARAQRWAYRHRHERRDQDQGYFGQQTRGDYNEGGWRSFDSSSDRGYRDTGRWYWGGDPRY